VKQTNKHLHGRAPKGYLNDVGYPRVGMEREGAPLSPDCFPTLGNSNVRSINDQSLVRRSRISQTVCPNAVALFRCYSLVRRSRISQLSKSMLARDRFEMCRWRCPLRGARARLYPGQYDTTAPGEYRALWLRHTVQSIIP
jgi:hypothetical protein